MLLIIPERERGGGVNRDKMHSTKCSKRCARTKIERREEGGLEKEKEKERERGAEQFKKIC